MKLNSILLLVILSAVSYAAEIALVRNGRAEAEIILPPSPSPAERFAAQELQYWIREITGAELPVRDTGGAEGVKIFLGKGNASEFAEDLKALEGSDGYACRNRNGNLYIFGSIPKGTLNGVFRFLENNSDIIWPRPQYTVFSKQKDFTATRIDELDRPYSRVRGLGLTLVSGTLKDSLWRVRNNENWSKASAESCAEWGMQRELGGHIFARIMPEKAWFKSNPEFFPEIRGIRRPGGSLCLTAPGIGEVYEKNLSGWIEERLPMDTLMLGINDTSIVCRCAGCLAPIRLPDGSVVTKDDPAFLSTRWYLFVNPIAEKVWSKYKIRTLVYAYLYLIISPKVRISDHILVSFHPHPRDMKTTYEDCKPLKGSEDFGKLLLDYRKVGKEIRLREYYGCNGGFPRPDEYVAVKDMRFAMKHGVREFTAEHPVDRDASNWDPMPSAYWDANAVTAWTITRLWWDPSQDLEALRSRFLERTYREAAPAMKKYYRRIHDLWFSKPDVSTYNDRLISTSKKYFIETGEEQNLRALLDEAEKAAKHPVSRKLVQLARAAFDAGCGLKSRIIVKKTGAEPGFDSPDWKETSVFSDFSTFAHREIPFPAATSVAMLHDAKNLYIKVNCAEASPPDPQAKGGVFDQWIPGDFVSLHFAGSRKKNLHTLSFDRYGNTFDARRSERKWNSGMKVEYRRGETSWEALVTVPLAALEYVPEHDKLNRIYGVFHRRHTPPGGEALSATSQGVTLDNVRSYMEIFLER